MLLLVALLACLGPSGSASAARGSVRQAVLTPGVASVRPFSLSRVLVPKIGGLTDEVDRLAARARRSRTANEESRVGLDAAELFGRLQDLMHDVAESQLRPGLVVCERLPSLGVAAPRARVEVRLGGTALPLGLQRRGLPGLPPQLMQRDGQHRATSANNAPQLSQRAASSPRQRTAPYLQRHATVHLRDEAAGLLAQRRPPQLAPGALRAHRRATAADDVRRTSAPSPQKKATQRCPAWQARRGRRQAGTAASMWREWVRRRRRRRRHRCAGAARKEDDARLAVHAQTPPRRPASAP